MDEKGWFTAGGRLIGLWLLIQAVQSFSMLLTTQVGLFEPKITLPGSYVLAAFFSAAIGLYLLGWSQHLARFVCCRTRETSDKQDEASGSATQD